MKKLIPILVVILLGGCKATEQTVVGSYSHKHFPKTRLVLYANKTFECTFIQPNPYLLPFDHPSEYYFKTSGEWILSKGNRLSLNSSSHHEDPSLISLQADTSQHFSFSQFTFLDVYQDTIPLLYVQYSDSSVTAALHKTMPSFSQDLKQCDTLSFHFYGYPPVKFKSKNRKNGIYQFQLTPENRPGLFIDYQFKVKKNKLIDLKYKGRFIKNNNR